MKMVNPEHIVSFQRAIAGTGPTLYLSAAFSDDLQTHDKYFPRNRVFQFSLWMRAWAAYNVDQYIKALCADRVDTDPEEVLVALSESGEVIFKSRRISFTESISYVDPYTSQTETFAGAEGLSKIGSDFYACGSDGKVFQRVGNGVWRLLTPGLGSDLQAMSKASDDAVNASGGDWTAGIGIWLAIDSRNSFHEILGFSDKEVYVTGDEGGLLFWDGKEPTWIPGMPKVALFGMYPEQGNIWVCGSQGTILHGNHHDGFDGYSLGTDHSFNKIIRFKGKIYLSANGGFGGPVGLFTYDGRKLEQVSCGLTPDIHDIHTVTAADGILWAVGYRDILCFDGKTWQRIDHPDNPPVR